MDRPGNRPASRHRLSELRQISSRQYFNGRNHYKEEEMRYVIEAQQTESIESEVVATDTGDASVGNSARVLVRNFVSVNLRLASSNYDAKWGCGAHPSARLLYARVRAGAGVRP